MLSAVEQLKLHSAKKDTAQLAIDVICAEYGFTKAELQSPERTQPLTLARQLTMVLVKESTGWSLPHVGEQFNREHTTVLHAIMRIKSLCEDDPEFESEFQRLKKLIE